MAFFAREKVNDLFEREKIMLSPKKDGVPEDKVAEIFGEDAVKRVKEVNETKGITWDSYGSRVSNTLSNVAIQIIVYPFSTRKNFWISASLMKSITLLMLSGIAARSQFPLWFQRVVQHE